jgi:hypothetical protein
MQQKAGVAARRHDARRAPRPLTVEALATSGQVATATTRPPSGGESTPRSGNPNQNRNRNRNRNRRRRSPQRVR